MNICIIHQKDYVGGGELAFYTTEKDIPIQLLIKKNYSNIENLFDDPITCQLYGIDAIMTEEEKIDRFFDNDYIAHYAMINGKRTLIARTSFNSVNNTPYVDIIGKVDVCTVDPCDNTTVIDVKVKGKKVFTISDQTRTGIDFIERFFMDVKKKEVYMHEEHDDEDEAFKCYGGYKARIIPAESIM